MSYDLAAIRKRIADKKKGGKPAEEFRIPRLSEGESRDWYFYVLGPFTENEILVSGAAERGMGIEFAIEHGFHYIDGKRIGCPRVSSLEENTERCEYCDFGFAALDGVPKTPKNEEERKNIRDSFLSRSSWLVNIYFPDIEQNPEDVRGKVFWYNSQKTIYDKWIECLYRESAGHEDDPEAFGCFFDENSANLFKLAARWKHQNDYNSSKFLPKEKPIATKKVTKGGKKVTVADKDKIAEIMASRHDLFSIPAAVDASFLSEKIKIISGDVDPDDPDNKVEPDDPTDDPTEAVEAKSAKKTKAKAKDKAKPKSAKKGPAMTAPSAEKESEDEDEISGELPASEEDEDEVIVEDEAADEEVVADDDEEVVADDEDDELDGVDDILSSITDDDEAY